MVNHDTLPVKVDTSVLIHIISLNSKVFFGVDCENIYQQIQLGSTTIYGVYRDTRSGKTYLVVNDENGLNINKILKDATKEFGNDFILVILTKRQHRSQNKKVKYIRFNVLCEMSYPS